MEKMPHYNKQKICLFYGKRKKLFSFKKFPFFGQMQGFFQEIIRNFYF